MVTDSKEVEILQNGAIGGCLRPLEATGGYLTFWVPNPKTTNPDLGLTSSDL